MAVARECIPKAVAVAFITPVNIRSVLTGIMNATATAFGTLVHDSPQEITVPLLLHHAIIPCKA